MTEEHEVVAEAAVAEKPLIEKTGPVGDKGRIESLDVLRGFALLGILLINILAFGMPYATLSNPGFDLVDGQMVDIFAWASVELLAEGAMRCLFSMLFGAGVVLFTTGVAGKSKSLHFRRMFYLLLFGLFDAYVLLWLGDILVNYAIAGGLLYFFRNMKARSLFIWFGVFFVLISAINAISGVSLQIAEDAAQVVAEAEDVDELDPMTIEMAKVWEDFQKDFLPTEEEVASEISQRRASYVSAFKWNIPKTNEMMFMVLPSFMLWDALAMMLLGMAFYKAGIMQGERSNSYYQRLSLIGFGVGFSVNALEIYGVAATDFHALSSFGQMQWTYHIGRLGVAVGYLGLLVLFCKTGAWRGLRARLAAVGRMALTNYLMHSVICLFIFTGAGLALLGRFSRAEVYVIVFGIWILQLLISPVWLKIFQYGPVEWLWRALTYRQMPKILRR